MEDLWAVSKAHLYEDFMAKRLAYRAEYARRTASSDPPRRDRGSRDRTVGVVECNNMREQGLQKPVINEEDEDSSNNGGSVSRRRSGSWPRTRSLNAPSPIQQFGPCGRIMKNSAMVMTIQDPASQRLTWYKPPLTVLVIKKARDISVLSPFVQLVKWLIEDKRMVVFVESTVLEDPHLDQFSSFVHIKEKLMTFKDGKDDLTDKIDFIICLGGDGTLLYASHLFQESVPPVMAFHLGSLGFLTPFKFDNFPEKVNNVLEGNAALTLRSRLRCIVIKKGDKVDEDNISVLSFIPTTTTPTPPSTNTPLTDPPAPPTTKLPTSASQYKHPHCPPPLLSYQSVTCANTHINTSIAHVTPTAAAIAAARPAPHPSVTITPTNLLVLNEVVVDRGPSPYLSNIDLFLDGKHITSVQGDGLIVSTPTGSTAYAVAAGASMIHPSVPAMMVTPICPHSLSFRPIVVPAGVELNIKISPDSRNTSWVSFDGRNRQELLHGDSLRVTTSVYPVPSICAQDQITDWFASLAECLHWNVRKRQKHLDELTDLTHSSSEDTIDSVEMLTDALVLDNKLDK